MIPAYIFSGLGTDERVFQYSNFSGFSIHYMQWIPPNKEESISSYAQRLTAQILFDQPTLIGVSFGGIVAMEVAKIIKVKRTILIASAKTKQEIPLYYRIAGALHLHKLLPAGLLIRSNRFTYWLFGITKKQHKNLLAFILRDTDKSFLKWAIHAIVSWKNEEIPVNTIHLHGTADRILPYRFVKDVIPIESGGHFMTVNKAPLLTSLLRKLLSS